jgi:tRNA 2-thiouridine synthesizing protein D
MAKLTIAIMDGPYESETTTTVMRIVDAALRKGHSVNVFAYEGAVSLSLKDQAQHPNPVKMTNVEQQDHPTTARFIQGLFKMSDGRLNWTNCGMCVDERGATSWIEGPKRGGPADFFKWTQESTNTLVIGTR